MNKDKIIQLAFIKLGEVHNRYNDNSSDQYRVASFLLEDIIENLAIDTTFLFNATTIRLNKTVDPRDELGRNRFHIPEDFLNLIRTNFEVDREGEYLYSLMDKVALTYCKKIEFIEFPDYLQDLLVAKLMVALAESYSTYKSNLPTASLKERSAYIDVLNLEGLTNGGVGIYELV